MNRPSSAFVKKQFINKNTKLNTKQDISLREKTNTTNRQQSEFLDHFDMVN